MINSITNTGRKITDDDIINIENLTHTFLPDDYKNFLRKNNGGIPIPQAFPISGYANNSIGQVQIFFGIDHPIESCRLDWNYRIFHDRIPRYFFPIACEDTGSIICISLSGFDEGHVYYWDHSHECSPPTYSNVFLIAKTFQYFLESIYFYDPLAEGNN